MPDFRLQWFEQGVSLRGCRLCKLYTTSESYAVPGIGPDDAEVVFVGESLGDDEAAYGEPFVGRAGQTLNRLLRLAGTSRHQVFITNAVHCQPPGNQTTNTHVEHCMPFLDHELQRLRNKKVIVALGGHALYALTGRKKITTWAGVLTRSEKYDCLVLATYHPAYLFHQPGAEDAMVEHFRQALAIASGETIAYGQSFEEDYQTLTNFNDARALLTRYKTWHDRLGVDTETGSLDYWLDDIILWIFSERPGHSRLLPMELNEVPCWTGRQQEILKRDLYEVMTGPARWCGAYLKFDFRKMKRYFDPWPFDPTTEWDVSNSDRLINENQRHGLKEQSALRTILGRYDTPVLEWFAANPKFNNQYRKLPSEIIVPYALRDPDAVMRIIPQHEERLTEEGTLPLYLNTERRVGDALRRMETVGIRSDTERLTTQGRLFGERIDENMQWLRDTHIPIDNVMSSKQLIRYFIDELDLPIYKKTKKGNPSLGKEVMEYYGGVLNIEAARKCQVTRKLRHFRSTFLDGTKKSKGLLGWVYADGRIHPEFEQWPVTGRLSAHDPNLHAIPRPTEIGEYKNDPRLIKINVRNVFIPTSEDWELVIADYSQMELRIAACWWNDPLMLSQFASGIDIHGYVTEFVLGVKRPCADCLSDRRCRVGCTVSKEQWSTSRDFAKRINFGVLYGMGAYKLAATLQIPEDQAEAYLAEWFDRYHGIRDGIESSHVTANELGYTATWAGRRRHLTAVHSTDRKARFEALRQGANHEIQGGGADIIFRAMTQLDKLCRTKYRPRRDGTGAARMLLQVHDELASEARREVVEEFAADKKRIMEQLIPELKYTFPVDLEIQGMWKGPAVRHVRGVTKEAA